MAKTSIIVPVYNTAEYLSDCFESIFNQSQTDLEVIAVNDGSTDDSLYLLEEIKAQHPEMIIYSQKNQGLGAARNKGVELATGEYIYFLDSDDCLMNNAMEICYRYADEFQLDVLLFDAETFGEINHMKKSYDRRDIIAQQECVFSGTQFANRYWPDFFLPTICLTYLKTQFVQEHKLTFLPRVYYEDIEYFCRMIPLANRMMYIPQILYRRRYRNNSITMSTFDIRHANDYLQVMSAVSRQEHCKAIEDTIQKLKMKFIRTLLRKCKKNNLLNDEQFVKNFYHTILELYGKDIKNIISYKEIELLCHFSDGLTDDVFPIEVKRMVNNRKAEILKILFEEVPFQNEDKCIGIYGTGKNTDFLINEFEKYVGRIKANLIFIDSNIKSGIRKYRNCDIYHINDIDKFPLEHIIVASSKYEIEMCRLLENIYGKKYKIICLKSDLQIYDSGVQNI